MKREPGQRRVGASLLGVSLLGALLFAPRFALAQSSPPPSDESWPPILRVSPVPGSVLVHIESPQPVDLERETGDRSDPFDVICMSPCDTWVPVTSGYRLAGDGTWVPVTSGYRIAGDGTRASRRFELLANAGGRQTLVVSPASSSAFGLGIVLIVVGGVALGIAGLALLGAALPSDSPNSSNNSGAVDLVLGLLAGGLGAEGGGITLVVLNHHSGVQQTAAFGSNPRSSSALFPSDAEHRDPPILGSPRVASWPLLRLTF